MIIMILERIIIDSHTVCWMNDTLKADIWEYGIVILWKFISDVRWDCDCAWLDICNKHYYGV